MGVEGNAPKTEVLRPEEFAELVETHGAALLRYLRRRVGNAELAEDLLQDTFVAAYQHRAEVRPTSVRAWLFTIAANRARNALRDGRWSVANERAVAQRLGAPCASPPTPEQETLRAELGSRLDEALQQLPPERREAVVLRDIEGLSYGEIAQVVGITEGAARVRVHRTREMLREALRPYLVGEPVGQEEA
jgi:RNA polymerase sigma factor (sigma-70 family)